MGSIMSDEKTSAVEVKKSAAAAGASKKGGIAKSVAKNVPYAEMITKAIMEQKERRGSSLTAIKKYVCAKYPVDVQKAGGLVLRALRKMEKDGRVIAGAKDGQKGSGCYKIAPEEKERLRKEQNKAVKKLVTAAKSKKPAKKVVGKKSGKVKVAKKSGKVKVAKKSGKVKVVKKSGKVKVVRKSGKVKVAKKTVAAGSKKSPVPAGSKKASTKKSVAK